MGALTDPVVIGIVVAPHGVRGTLKVKVPGSGRHLRRGVEPVVKGERRRILGARETPKGFLIDLQGIENRESAAGLREVELLLDRAELDAPQPEEFYVGDLVGLVVYDQTGEHIGSVVDLLETSAYEILVIRDYGSADERYVPFTFEHVPTVDPKGGCIVISLLIASSE
ncbi:MAG: 16S rRNA processing protein RimM [Rubrobacter sp.]|nr:16S rRNA processing protein RimM [Rubrobacter sp.]